MKTYVPIDKTKKEIELDDVNFMFYEMLNAILAELRKANQNG